MRKQVYALRRKRMRSGMIFLVITAILTMLLVRLDKAVRPNLCAVCESETRSFAAGLMADCISETLSEQTYSYESIANLIYDETGEIAAVETRTEQINQLQSAMLSKVQKELAECRDATLEVSLGTASGVWLFAGRGPRVNVRLLPVGHASVRIISSLEAAGINQTCHTIRAVVTAEITAAIPFSETTVTTEYDCLISETILVGRVPDAYLEFGGEI